MSRMVRSKVRKQNTREEIEQGAQMVKAGRLHEKHAHMLGLMPDARQKLKGDENERSRPEGTIVKGSDHASE
jgi:hypothetical protein|nr:conjugal transfer protein TraD [Hoeflea sp. 108]